MSSSDNAPGFPTDLPDEVLADLMSLIDDMGKGALSQAAPPRDAKKKSAPAVESDAKKKSAPAVESDAKKKPARGVESDAKKKPARGVERGAKKKSAPGVESDAKKKPAPAIEDPVESEPVVGSEADSPPGLASAAFLGREPESEELALPVEFDLDVELAVTSSPDVDLDLEAAALADSEESDPLALDFHLDEVDEADDEAFDLAVASQPTFGAEPVNDGDESRQSKVSKDLLAEVSPDARIVDSGGRFSAHWFRYNWPFLLAAFFILVGAILILLVLTSN